VYSQNNWYLNAESARLIHELPVDDNKVGVCCAVSTLRLVLSIFYDDTVNAARYVNNILCPFFVDVTDEERLYGVLQQDTATAYMAYMAHANLEALRKVFGHHVISHGLRPYVS
jgi:hypothetical protein